MYYFKQTNFREYTTKLLTKTIEIMFLFALFIQPYSCITTTTDLFTCVATGDCNYGGNLTSHPLEEHLAHHK